LPSGNSICHGDYNPSNVIINFTKPVFLDWGGVSKGDATADVAHTLLILKNGQFPPNTTFILKFIFGLGRRTFADIYFHTYKKYNSLDLSVLSKWEMVRAVGRLAYGGSEERQALLKFIKRHYKNRNNNRIILF
jgi:aminoglycoside phosphotransferase (APT) family kinase protein